MQGLCIAAAHSARQHSGKKSTRLLQFLQVLPEKTHEDVLCQILSILHTMHSPLQPVQLPSVVVAIERVQKRRRTSLRTR
ncbi:hypothetical protein P245_17845 [Comamonas thiooxydans]|uniref:Uncharacterized protein n=1 Tax=Comamonas thiooxydans TaxID=363952 RepID=A0A0E3BDQ5_9BURK|nr:hypothetical protein P245_17845 [Comamonas thiooxydans]